MADLQQTTLVLSENDVVDENELFNQIMDEGRVNHSFISLGVNEIQHILNMNSVNVDDSSDEEEEKHATTPYDLTSSESEEEIETVVKEEVIAEPVKPVREKSKAPPPSFFKNMELYNSKLEKDKMLALGKKSGGVEKKLARNQMKTPKPQVTEKGVVFPQKTVKEKEVSAVKNIRLQKIEELRQQKAQNVTPVVIQEKSLSKSENLGEYIEKNITREAPREVPPSVVKHMNLNEKKKAIATQKSIPPKYASVIEKNVQQRALRNVKNINDLRKMKEAEGLGIDVNSPNATIDKIRELKMEHTLQERAKMKELQEKLASSKQLKINKILENPQMNQMTKALAIQKMSIDSRRRAPVQVPKK